MNPSNPSPPPPPADIHDRVTIAVRSHRIKIRVLTSMAFVFGFLAVAASGFLVLCYLILYLPKQKQILRDAEIVAQQASSMAGGGEESVQDAVKRIDKFLGVQVTLTHVVSMGTTMVAVVVGVLSLGTLVLLIVVILNRRVTLNQINVSLAQLADQLRELQASRSTGPPAV